MIINDCPHCKAISHRDMRNEMPRQIYEDIMESTIEELIDSRNQAAWMAIRDTTFDMSGIVLSMN
jgi:hypothetical protein